MKDGLIESVAMARLAVSFTVCIRRLFRKGMLTSCDGLVVSKIVCRTNGSSGIEILFPYKLGNVSVPFKIRTEDEFFVVSTDQISPSSLCPTIASKVLDWFGELGQKTPCQRNGNSIMVPKVLLKCFATISDVTGSGRTVNINE